MRNKARENKGITLIALILFILITILIIFLIYEIVFVDILGLRETNTRPITTEIADRVNSTYEEEVYSNEEIIEPIINQNQVGSNEPQISNQYTHYYYNQLDDNAKIIYKGLEDNIQNLRTGTYKIDFGTSFNDLLNSEQGEEKLNIAFQSAWNAFTYDNVDVFYIDITKLILTTQTTSIGNFATHKVYLGNRENETYLESGFSYEMLNQMLPRLENLREQVINTLEGYTTYQKLKYVHDWLIDNLEYDTTYQNENIYNIYGTLTSGVAVCEGYARTYKYILDGLNIPCILVSGTGTNSNGETESHAWNYVNLDNKWYAIDLTWDDPILLGNATLTDEVRYRHFLKGSNEFLQYHKEDGNLSENSITFKFPTLEKEDYQQ